MNMKTSTKLDAMEHLIIMFGFLKKKIKGHTRTYKAGKEILTDATDAKKNPLLPLTYISTQALT